MSMMHGLKLSLKLASMRCSCMCTRMMKAVGPQSGNILLSGDEGSAKIAETGLSQVLRCQTHASMSGLRGTFSWAAPEALQGDSSYLHACPIRWCIFALIPDHIAASWKAV